MKHNDLGAPTRSLPRYLGAAPHRRITDAPQTDDAAFLLAEMRAKLEGLLTDPGLDPARREVLAGLATEVGTATARLADDTVPTHGNGHPRYDEPRWLARLGSDLEEMQSAEDVADLLAHLARVINRELEGDACMISLHDRERGTLRDVAASSRTDRRLNLVANEHSLSDYPETARVMDTDECIQVSLMDPNADRAEREFLVELGFSRVLICPLTLAGETVGTAEIYRYEDVPFKDTDGDRVNSLANFTSGPYSRICLAEQLRDHYTRTLEVLTSALEVRDVQTHQHTGRMRELAMALADAMRLSPEEKTCVRLGAMLHDVGKLGVPDSILLKPGPLTDSEWEIMRKHPEIGEEMLARFDFLAPAVPVVRHHHERWDGAGYPDRLVAEEIPLAARIVAVCDALDAMTSDRPYRPATSLEAACDELVACAGTQFDPLCVAVLVNLVKDSGGRELDARTVVRYAS